MRITLLLSLIFSVLAAPVAMAVNALPRGNAASVVKEYSCCSSLGADQNRCCLQSNGDRILKSDCCQSSNCQDMSCHCPSCPCGQLLPTHYWSVGDTVILNVNLEARIGIASDAIDPIFWEPSAPVPKALV